MSPNLRPFSKELKRSDALPSASRSSQVEARVFRFQSLITAIHCAHAAANRCGRHECAGNARGSGRSERCTSLVGNLPHGLDKLQASEAAGPRVGRRRRFGSRNVCRRKHCKIGRGEGGNRCTAISFVIWECVWPRTSAPKENDSEWEPRVHRRDNTAEDQTSQPDALHLTQCNFVLCPIVEFGCSRRLMAGHLLGVLEPSVVLQVNRDTGCPPGV